MSLIRYHAQLFQLGYVTDDLDRGMDYFASHFGAGKWVQAEVDLKVIYRGVEAPFRINVAVAIIGDRQIELIRPHDCIKPFYCEGFDTGRHVVCLHHLGILVSGPDSEWERLKQEVRASGQEFAVLGEAGAPVKFAYLDTRAGCGHYTEYLWRTDQAERNRGAMPNNA